MQRYVSILAALCLSVGLIAADYSVTPSDGYDIKDDGSIDSRGARIAYGASGGKMLRGVLVFQIPNDFDNQTISAANLTAMTKVVSNNQAEDVYNLYGLRISSDPSITAADYDASATLVAEDMPLSPIAVGDSFQVADDSLLVTWLEEQRELGNLAANNYIILRFQMDSTPGGNYDYIRLDDASPAELTFSTGGGTGTISNLQAIAVSHESVQLTWDAYTDAVRYIVTRATQSDFSDAVELDNNVQTTSYTDTGLSADTTYFYQVDASDTSL